MRLKGKVILLSSLLVGSMAMPVMAATFEVPRSFEIMYVDLQSAGNFGNDFKVDIANGHHQIVIRFNKIMRGGDATQYQSEPIIIDVNVEKDAYLTLKAPYISTDRKAELYAKKPEFKILDDSSGREVSYQQQMLPVKSGLQNTRDYVAEIERLTAKNVVVTDAPVPAPYIENEKVALEMMQFWYNRSDDVTRKAIRVWIADDRYKPEMKNIQLEMSQFWFKKADREERKAFQVWLIK